MAHSRLIRGDASPLLTPLTRAIAHHSTPGTNLVPANLPAALAELSALAAVSVITRGVIASEDFRSAVDDIAARHQLLDHFRRHLRAGEVGWKAMLLGDGLERLEADPAGRDGVSRSRGPPLELTRALLFSP